MLFDVSNPFNLWTYTSHMTLNLTPEYINVVYFCLNIFVDFRKKISDILKLTIVKSIFKLLVILVKKTVSFRILWKERLLFHSRALPQPYPRVPTHGLTPGSHRMVPPDGPTPGSQPIVPLHDPSLGTHPRSRVLGPTPESRSHFSSMLLLAFNYCCKLSPS